MKKYVLVLVGIAVMAMFWVHPLCAAEEENENSRFQLFNAEYNSALIQTSQTTKFNEKKLFKINTKTGETWMLIDVFKEGRDIIYWKKIKEASDN